MDTDPFKSVRDEESIRKLMAETWPEHHQDLVALKVQLAVMAERIQSLTVQLTTLTAGLEARRTPLWHWWAPLAFMATSLGAIYVRFDSRIAALELQDQASIAKRAQLERDIERLSARLEQRDDP